MSVALITGSCGLVGQEACSFLAGRGFDIVGIDNDLRKSFFGKEGSVAANKKRLIKSYRNYRHHAFDVRNREKVESLFKKYNKNISFILHSAAQPSHDWAAARPFDDFSVNAAGTVIMLEALRKFSPEAVFIYTSSNKVYGDAVNRLGFIEKENRFELKETDNSFKGIGESMSVDNTMHSVFGASKLAADIMTQEYGRYYGLKTGIFRCGCISGPGHAGVQEHGFLSYLVKCAVSRKQYKIFGYKGKQVRDNIHSFDLVNAFYNFFENPRPAEIYNMGGSRFSNVSILEAIKICEGLTGEKFNFEYTDKSRPADHIWWISDIAKFKSDYPDWNFKYGLEETIKQIYEAQKAGNF